MTAATPNAGGGGEKPVKEQRILLWVEAPADKLKAPDSGLNIALEKLGRMQTRLRDIDRLWSKIASKTLPNLPTPTPSVRGPSVSGTSPGSPAPTVTAGGNVVRRVNASTEGIEGEWKTLFTSIDAAETKLLKQSRQKNGKIKEEIITDESKARAKALAEEMQGAKLTLKQQLDNAERIQDAHAKYIAQAQAYRNFQNTVAGSTSQKTPIQAALFDNVAAGAALDASKKESSARKAALADEEREKAEHGKRLSNAGKARLAEDAAREKETQKTIAAQQQAFDNARRAAHQGRIAAADLEFERNRRIAEGTTNLEARYRTMATAHARYSAAVRAVPRDGLDERERHRLDSLAAASDTSGAGFTRRAATSRDAALRSAARAAARQEVANAKADAVSQMATLGQAYANAIRAIPANATAAQRAVATQQAKVALHQGAQAYFGGVAAGTSNPQVRLQATQQLGAHTTRLANATSSLAQAQATLAQSTSHIGRNMVQNVMHVTAWAAAVGTLYGSLRLLKHGVASVVELEYAQARLGQVFTGGKEQVGGLTNEILKLAAANGRSSKEAMESAIQWSRLGLNRVQVLEAVRVSLMGANVAEISASEATEHLSSLMRVYGLNVRQLSSALGMLNATSNTFNVTNKDLLDGITRTSSAARQAGLSLAELIGFIGAGVGATGQTGSNIGNSMKSLIGAMAAPEKQKLIREKFNFETTDAQGDLKDMSSLMAELYVHFQKLNEAQKQSFIFNVAGKNQASRVTALLDNYIKAQSLAIQSLLGLNSAETENQKIRDTAKAQLQGLITEFERLAVTIGGTTGSLGLFSSVVTALRDSLTLLSASGGAAGVLLISVMAAIAAKSLVMTAAMGSVGRSGGILANSMSALVAALRDVARAMISGLRYYGATGAAMSVTARSTHGAAAAFRALGVAVGVAVAELAVVAGIIYLLSQGFSKAMEGLGLSSDTANKAIDQFSESAERARGAAEAAALQVKLFDTTLKALKANQSSSGRSGIIAGVVEGMAPYTSEDLASDAAKRAKDQLRESIRRQLDEINGLTNATQRNAAFERVFTDATVRASEERVKAKQRERAATAAAMEAALEERNRLSNKRWGSADARQKNQAKIEELNTKSRRQFHEDSSEQEAARTDYRNRNEAHLTYLEVQKRLVTDIKNLWNEMAGDTYQSQLDKEIGAEETILRTLQERLRVEERMADSIGAPRLDELDAEMKRNQRLSAALQQQLSGGLSGSSSGPIENLGFSPFAPGGVEKLRELANSMPSAGRDEQESRRRIQAAREWLPTLEKWWDLQSKLNDAELEMSRLQSQPGMRGNQARREELVEEIALHKRALEAAKSSMAMTRMRDTMKLGGQLGQWESSSFKVGYNDTDALANQFEKTGRASEQHAMKAAELEERIARARGGRIGTQFSFGGTSQIAPLVEQAKLEEMATASVLERAKALAQGQEQMNLMLEITKQGYELEQKKNQAVKDYNKNMALGSPGQVLRMMALSKLTDGFKNMRGFMGFDAESKRLVHDRMAPEAEFNRNKALRDKMGIGTDSALQKRLEEMEKWLAIVRRGNQQQPAQAGINQAAVDAATASINRLGGAANGAADALIRFMNSFQPNTQGMTPPTNPQSPFDYNNTFGRPRDYDSRQMIPVPGAV